MVTLAELFEEDEEDGLPGGWPNIMLTLAEEELGDAGIVVFEGWQPSHIRGLWYRVNPARPQNKQLRNVHVAPKRHINAKRYQASWNENTKRHDRLTFNKKFGSRADVQEVAKVALGLPQTEILEHLTLSSGMARLLIEGTGIRVGEVAALISRESRRFLERHQAATPPLGGDYLIREELVRHGDEDFLIQALNTGNEVVTRIFRQRRPWGCDCSAELDVISDMRAQLGIDGVAWLIDAQKGHIAEWLEHGVPRGPLLG
jgi:hypothetical protein